MNSEERAAERGLTTAAITCAFCRTPVPESDEEMLARRRKRVERNDPDAILSHASDYDFGTTGLPVDHAKCVDLHRQSADLGSPSAQFQLGNFLYDGAMGLGQNKEEALKFWKKAAEGGHVVALYNLGCIEGRNGNNIAAMRHWRSSASGGMRGSMEGLIMYFEGGLLRHGDLAVTLQAMYLARAEMKSEDRDQFIEFLKMGGENVGYDGSRGSFRIRK
jgi:TPR repeat protein